MQGFLGLIIFGLVLAVAAVFESRQRAKWAAMSPVKEDREYPNNHHLPGVGYYHAAAGRWFARPWNEFQEGRGYFWAGEWHAEPDQALCQASVPEAGEIKRVNAAWREADPDRSAAFWDTVDRSGFGAAINRREGQ